VYVCAFVPGDGQSLIALTQLPEGAGDQVQANLGTGREPPLSGLAKPLTEYSDVLRLVIRLGLQTEWRVAVGDQKEG
jgi:hypothetical protein